MSQDIQPFNNPLAGDYWTQGQMAAPGSGQPMPPKNSPLRKAHRLLRGRYPLAIALAAFSGITFAVLGSSLMTPKYEAQALINFDPIITSPGLTDVTVPMYAQMMQSQLQLMQSTGLADDALNNKAFAAAWQKAYPNSGDMSSNDFALAVDPVYVRGTTVVKLGFTDKNPQVAEAGTKAVLDAYMERYGSGIDIRNKPKLALWNKRVEEINGQIAQKKEALSKLGEEFGSVDLTIPQQQTQEQLGRINDQMQQAKIDLDTATQAQATAQAQGAKPSDKDAIVNAIASVDPQMRNLIEAKEAAIVAFNDTVELHNYGKSHPAYIAGQRRISNADQAIQNHARDFIAQNAGRAIPGINDTTGLAVKFQQARYDNLVKQHDEKYTQLLKLNAKHTEVETVRAEIGNLQTELEKTNGLIKTVTDQEKLAQNIKVIGDVSTATIMSDKRKLAAGVGFLFGGLLPIGLMMLYGSVDHRFRYSDDTDDADLAGVALLGILPNLPDRLSDPQQAGIAAHCVHQIRTMLQINRSNDEPQVLAITSAAPADGKTSLTLALGLSYAACGARTLLIDCDLVAAGLSHRLNVNAPEGVLEAVSNRALLEFVRTTDIADVAILPVGTRHAHHASTLSPVALRRLLSEAKKNFDIILVDTGPILGSIEASLVCAAADRTILTVARNQQRLLVERSIGHLQAIGAGLAGVVFNRAQARDFERSMSGLALRSRPPVGSNPPPTTPTGKATTGGFKRAG